MSDNYDYTESEDYSLSVLNITFEDSKILRHDIVDLVKLLFLAAIFLIAAPLNISALISLIKQHRQPNQRRVLNFQLNLCISDLLMTFFYIPSEFIWLLTVQFYANTFICKTLKFLTLFQVYLASNIVVCISLDRMLTVVRPMRFSITSKKYVKAMIIGSYSAAALFSLPQFYFWKVTIILGCYRHCTHLYKFDAQLDGVQDDFTEQYERIWYAYSMFHLFAACWIPIVLITVSYLVILQAIAARHRWLRTTSIRVHFTRRRNPRPRKLTPDTVSLRSTTIIKNANVESPDRPDHTDLLSAGRQDSNHSGYSSKATRIAGMIVGCFVAARLPYFVIDFLAVIGQLDGGFSRSKVIGLFYEFTVVTSIINPFIYYRHSAKT